MSEVSYYYRQEGGKVMASKTNNDYYNAYKDTVSRPRRRTRHINADAKVSKITKKQPIKIKK